MQKSPMSFNRTDSIVGYILHDTQRTINLQCPRGYGGTSAYKFVGRARIRGPVFILDSRAPRGCALSCVKVTVLQYRAAVPHNDVHCDRYAR